MQWDALRLYLFNPLFGHTWEPSNVSKSGTRHSSRNKPVKLPTRVERCRTWLCTFQPRQLHTPQLLFIGPFGRRLWTKQHSQPGELNNDLGETWRNRRTWTWWQWRDGMEDGWKWLEVIYRSWHVALHANPVLAGHVALFVPHSRSHGLSMVLPRTSPPPKSIFLR